VGRKPYKLKAFRERLIKLYRKGTDDNTILSTLFKEHGLKVSRSTLRRRLRVWNVPKRNIRLNITNDLKNDLRALFFECFPSDNELWELLKDDGYEVSLNSIRELRRSMDLFRRYTPEQANRLRERLKEELHNDTLLPHVIQHQGQRLLRTYLRHQTELTIPNQLSFDLIRSIYPNSIQERYKLLKTHRGGFTTPGPDYI